MRRLPSHQCSTHTGAQNPKGAEDKDPLDHVTTYGESCSSASAGQRSKRQGRRRPRRLAYGVEKPVHQVPQYLNAGGPRIRFYGTME